MNSYIDDLVAQRTVVDYETFRYVLFSCSCYCQFSPSMDSIVKVLGSSTLPHSERMKLIEKLQYTSLDILAEPS